MFNLKNLMIIKLSFLFVVFCNVVVDISHKILLQNIAFKIFDSSEQVVWISLINLLIILPFLLLFSTSGYLSDRFNKKDILIYGAYSSFGLSLLMVVAYISGNFYFAMGVLMLLAVQSAIYSPAKFGIIIDIYGKDNLSAGNSSLQGVSIVGILFAMAITSLVFESFYATNHLDTISTKEALLTQILPLTYYIVPIAFLELAISILVLKKIDTSSSNKKKKLNKDALVKGKLLSKNIKLITSNKIVYLSVIGLSIFWAISQGLIVVFPSYAKEYLDITDTFIINGVIAASGIGIAIGSYLYARVSKHYIEVGTIPIATIGMAFMIYLSTSVQSATGLALSFLLFGIFGGLFVVPLNALIQFNTNKKKLGTILAGNNWFQSLFMFAMLAFTTVVSLNHIDPLTIIYIILLITLVGTLYTTYQLPKSLILMFLKLIVGFKYKLEVNGIKNIPSSGGTLLLGNHVSWIDWAIVLMSSPREVKFVMDRTYYSKWYINWLLKIFKAIPISNASSKSAMETVAKELDAGNVVVLFPEGTITRNGHLSEFKKGFEKILGLTQEDVKVVPFYIRGLWESMFSRANKKFKESYNLNSVTIVYGQAFDKENVNIINLKQSIIELSSHAWKEHINNLGTLNETILDRMKKVGSELIFADSTGVELSGHKFLTTSIIFKDILKDKIKGQNIGLLLPTTSAGAFVNYSVLMMGKTAVNLNYTSSVDSIIASIEKAEIKTILASRKFISKLESKGIDVNAILDKVDTIYLEDLKPLVSKPYALMTFLSVKFLPSFILRLMHITKVKKDDTAVILFSSGSEGTPKGIELTSDNILGNLKQIATILNVNHDDTMVGSLPLFHAFGITVTTFLPLVEGIKCVAHPDPTDGLGIGKIVAKYNATIMCGTSTFYRLYTKNPKVNPLMFESLRLVVAGAEKLRDDVRKDFKNKFGKDIYEGYGATETAPVATCNLPDVLTPEFTVQKGAKQGTVGLPLPGTTIKIVDPSTYEELPSEQEGMIMISGIQVMKGYLKDENKTNEVIQKIDGKDYYVTGDKGKLDKDGFLTIVDRYSRFAKLGGEMVSLGSIEEQLSTIISSDNENIDFVTTALEDEKKGEKVILLISGVDEEFVTQLKENMINRFDNKLMIPSIIKIVDEIPKLGSGKKDFKGAKKLASEVI
jgi:acyl-[acyl-carrier-protein]-phospholipid O-acyltransferase/long-chain-fatty-acid--[acyl-carrier-protein] ligase